MIITISTLKRKLTLIRIATLFVVSILSWNLSFASELPTGWRFPTLDDLKDNFIRNQSVEKYIEASADFNGDNKEDYAYLVKSTTFSGEALLVKISGSQGYDWVILNQIDWGEEYPKVGLSMGVSVVKPGDYKTACGKGYWACQKDEEPLLKLGLHAIDYFRFESAASIFYWDREKSYLKELG